MVVSFNIFHSGSETDGVSSTNEGDDKSSASESEEPKSVDLHDMVECLLRSALRHPLNFDHVVGSLSKLASRGYSDQIMVSAMKIMETHNLRRPRRMVVYEAIAKSVITPDFDGKRSNLPSASVKSFIVRLVNDVDKTPSLDSEVTLTSLSQLVAMMSLSAFQDLVVNVLMTAEFVSGKPTVSTYFVTNALIEIFSNLVPRDDLELAVNDLIVRLDHVAALKHNNDLISALMKGVLRTNLIKKIDCFGSLKALFDFLSDQAPTPESLLATVYLMAVAASEPNQTLERHILDMGAKKCDEKLFCEIISVIFQNKVSLFQADSEIQTELFELLLQCPEAAAVWPLGNDELTVPFLCSKNDSVSALAALATLAKARKLSLSSSVIRFIDFELVNDERAPSGAASVVATLRLISALDETLVSAPMIAFVERFVCSPASAVSALFPQGIRDADLSTIRAEACATLVWMGANFSSSRAKKLLSHLLECLEHMPSVGVATVCHSLTLLVNRNTSAAAKLPHSQSFLILTWLLIQIDFLNKSTEESVESVISCLVAISGFIHPSLQGIWRSGRLTRLASSATSVAEEFAFAVNSIDFFSRDEKSKFFNVAIETIVLLLSGNGCTYHVKAHLIGVWEQVMHVLVPDQSVAAFTQRCLELLSLRDAVSASELCVAATGRAIGRLADRRLDAIAELVIRTHNSACAELLALGGGNGSVADSLRLVSNKTSFRGLFAFESTERKIWTHMPMKEICLEAAGHAVAAADESRLSDLRVKELISALIFDELKRDVGLLRDWVIKRPTKDDVLLLQTTAAVIRCVHQVCERFRGVDAEKFDFSYFENFLTETSSLLLDLLGMVGVLPDSFPTECVLDALAAVIAVSAISAEVFSNTLEKTLQSLVHSVPDNAATLSATALTRRCQAAARVVKSLFRHANSWMGFSRLVKAVFALGGNGPLPLLRWACVRIVAELVDETEEVRDEHDVNEFLETIAVIFPRITDTYAPVKDLAVQLVGDLFLRCQFTKDISSVDTARLALAVPATHVPTFVLLIVTTVHDADSSDFVVSFLHLMLSCRSDVFVPEDVAADAVVDAILTNAAFTPSPDSPVPPLSEPTRKKLVETLKYLAAVRFPIAIKNVLRSAISTDGVHAIHSFAREKTTLVFLAKELIERINGVEGSITAAEAMGHVLDCFDDSGVSSISAKYFCEIFSSLLMLLWREPGAADAIRLVIHKLCRAAAVERLPDSLSAESGMELMLKNSEHFRPKCANFLSPFLGIDIGSKQRSAALVLVSQLMGTDVAIDAQFLISMMEVVTKNEGSSEVFFALKSIAAIIACAATEEVLANALVLFTQHVGASENATVTVALRGICTVGEYAKNMKSSPLTAALMSTTLAQLRRVVDHTDVTIKAGSFNAIRVICESVHETDVIENAEMDQASAQFFASVSDLWIPCLLRSTDDTVSSLAEEALGALLTAAVADSPVAITPGTQFATLLSLVRTEICETSLPHLHSCSYYLLGLPSVDKKVAIAAARLVPLLIELLPEASKEAAEIVDDVLEKLLALSLIHREIEPLLTDVVIQGKRLSAL